MKLLPVNRESKFDNSLDYQLESRKYENEKKICLLVFLIFFIKAVSFQNSDLSNMSPNGHSKRLGGQTIHTTRTRLESFLVRLVIPEPKLNASFSFFLHLTSINYLPMLYIRRLAWQVAKVWLRLLRMGPVVFHRLVENWHLWNQLLQWKLIFIIVAFEKYFQGTYTFPKVPISFLIWEKNFLCCNLKFSFDSTYAVAAVSICAFYFGANAPWSTLPPFFTSEFVATHKFVHFLVNLYHESFVLVSHFVMRVWKYTELRESKNKLFEYCPCSN